MKKSEIATVPVLFHCFSEQHAGLLRLPSSLAVALLPAACESLLSFLKWALLFFSDMLR